MDSQEIRTTDDYAHAYRHCIEWLSMREHSQLELVQKLQRKGIDDGAIVDALLQHLIQDNYQSDERFAEVFCRSKVHSKHGARKIRYAMQQRGIDSSLIEHELRKYDDEFLAHAQDLIVRKAPRNDVAQLLSDRKLRDKVSRSLVNKGYDFDVIRLAFEILSSTL